MGTGQERVGISLGWNCHSAMHGVAHGLRGRRAGGYRTCPFDECISNPAGAAAAFREDFAAFTDPAHLTLMPAPFTTGGIRAGERLLVNTRYGFVFNHESPDHAGLYKSQGWAGGAEHFVADGYAEFRRRYEARIKALRAYLSAPDARVAFLLTLPRDDAALDAAADDLASAIRAAYPALDFEVLRLAPPETPTMVREHFALQAAARKAGAALGSSAPA